MIPDDTRKPRTEKNHERQLHLMRSAQADFIAQAEELL